MKRGIEKHRERLRNRISNASRERDTLERQQSRVDQCDKEVRFLTFQIESAEKEKKDGFDDELYKKKFRDEYLK